MRTAYTSIYLYQWSRTDISNKEPVKGKLEWFFLTSLCNRETTDWPWLIIIIIWEERVWYYQRCSTTPTTAYILWMIPPPKRENQKESATHALFLLLIRLFFTVHPHTHSLLLSPSTREGSIWDVGLRSIIWLSYHLPVGSWFNRQE